MQNGNKLLDQAIVNICKYLLSRLGLDGGVVGKCANSQCRPHNQTNVSDLHADGAFFFFALNPYKKANDLNELKKLQKPSDVIKLIFDCVGLLKMEKVQPVQVDEITIGIGKEKQTLPFLKVRHYGCPCEKRSSHAKNACDQVGIVVLRPAARSRLVSQDACWHVWIILDVNCTCREGLTRPYTIHTFAVATWAIRVFHRQDSYKHMQAGMLSDARFLQSIFAFSQNEKDFINDETVELMAPYLELEGFNPAVARNASKAAEGLCTWCRAMTYYHEASKVGDVLTKKSISSHSTVCRDQEITRKCCTCPALGKASIPTAKFMDILLPSHVVGGFRVDFSRGAWQFLINHQRFSYLYPHSPTRRILWWLWWRALVAVETLTSKSDHEIGQVVKPKLEALRIAEVKLEDAQKELEAAESKLQGCQVHTMLS